jgi:hypothetical protein
MPTYYEILNIQATATTTEIEQALDGQYGKYRRLVTHHDPNVVNQANLFLQTLEKIRDTLTEAGKRSAYDAAISSSLSGNIGVPIDSHPATLGTASMEPPFAFSSVPRKLPPNHAPIQRNWVCPKCQAPNAINSQFCKKCGESLASPCPTCGQLVEKNAEFCTGCGVNIKQAHHKIELEQQLTQYRNDQELTIQKAPVLDNNLPDLKAIIVKSGGWAIVSMAAGLTYLFASSGQFPGINLTGLVVALSGNTNYLSVNPQHNWLAIGVVMVIAVVSMFLGLLNKVSPLKGFEAVIAALFFISLPKTLQSSLILFFSDSIPQSAEQATSIATGFSLAMTAFIYAILILRMLAHVKNGFEKLKLYHKRLPKVGCLGGLFSLVLLAIPGLYGLHLVMLLGGVDVDFIANKYETSLWLLNAFQFLVIGVLLWGFTLLSWRTTRSLENQFQQFTLQRVEKIEKLTRQIQTLEQAIDHINLRAS